MKKLVNPMPSGGSPVFATETLSEVLTQETYDAMEAILSTIDVKEYHPSSTNAGNALVVEGGALSGSGPYDVAAGIAYFPTSKQFARFPQATGLAPATNELYINLDAPTIEQKTFFDSVLKDYTETHTATVSIAQGTEFVTIRTDRDYVPTFQQVLRDPVNGHQQVSYSIGTMNLIGGATKDIVAADRGLGSSNIRAINAVIYTDLAVNPKIVRPIEYQNGGHVELIEGSGAQFTIRVTTNASGPFDSADYNDTVATNRGYVHIIYN